MKLTFFALTVLICLFTYSCKEASQPEDYSGYSEKEFDLVARKDSTGKQIKIAHIKVNIPSQLDTFYQWHQTSDCSSCGRLEYRFADRKYVQFAESGFYWTTVPDSIFQLTFIHNPIVEEKYKSLPPLVEKDTAYLPVYIANQSTWCDKFIFLYKKHMVINHRPFILTAFTTSCSIITNNKPSLLFGAITSLKNTSLLILAETNAKDTTGFELMMNKAIQSIEISE